MIEYIEVERVGINKLNALGRDGWRPAALRWLPYHHDRCLGDDEEGWSGLLYREVDRAAVTAPEVAP